jgi:hypothetical protein
MIHGPDPFRPGGIARAQVLFMVRINSAFTEITQGHGARGTVWDQYAGMDQLSENENFTL